MKHTTIIQKTIILELNNQEIEWLKKLVQAPIGCTLGEERKEHAEIRRNFWDALNGTENR